MSTITDRSGREITEVKIGKPVKDIRTTNPNDVKKVPADASNELLVAIVSMGYNGTVTLNSGEKYKITLLEERNNKMLLTQQKLHTEYKNRRATLVPVSSRFVEITFKPFAFASNDFPSL
jgi:hypothetical protein